MNNIRLIGLWVCGVLIGLFGGAFLGGAIASEWDATITGVSVGAIVGVALGIASAILLQRRAIDPPSQRDGGEGGPVEGGSYRTQIDDLADGGGGGGGGDGDGGGD